ncbi:MAG: iron-sulfur cluster biosynthesis family protein, partial [Phormidesmis sp.]
MIQLTPAACKEINRLRQRQNHPDAACRLELRPSSCAQWAYNLRLEDAVTENDDVYTFEDVRLVVGRDRLDYIRGLKI